MERPLVPAPLQAGVHHQDVHARAGVRATLGELLQTGGDRGAVLGVDQVEQRPALQVGGRITHGSLGRRADVAEQAVRSADGQHVGGALHQRTQPGLRARERIRRSLLIPGVACHRDDGRKGDHQQPTGSHVALVRLHHRGDAPECHPDLARHRRCGDHRGGQDAHPADRPHHQRDGHQDDGGRHEHAPPGAPAEHRCQHRGEDQAEQGTVVQAAAAELLLGPVVADEDHQRQQQGEHPRVAEHQAEGLQPEQHRDGQDQDDDRDDARSEVARHGPSVLVLVRSRCRHGCNRLWAVPR